jgi:hypothetical protein
MKKKTLNDEMVSSKQHIQVALKVALTKMPAQQHTQVEN